MVVEYWARSWMTTPGGAKKNANTIIHNYMDNITHTQISGDPCPEVKPALISPAKKEENTGQELTRLSFAASEDVSCNTIFVPAWLRQRREREQKQKERNDQIDPRLWLEMVCLDDAGFHASTGDLIVQQWRSHPLFKRYERLLYDNECRDDTAIVAAHEAGHLIAAEALGWSASYVTIDCDWWEGRDGWYQVDETKADIEPKAVDPTRLTEYR